MTQVRARGGDGHRPVASFPLRARRDSPSRGTRDRLRQGLGRSNRRDSRRQASQGKRKGLIKDRRFARRLQLIDHLSRRQKDALLTTIERSSRAPVSTRTKPKTSTHTTSEPRPPMTTRNDLLGRGYFPRGLPPPFSTTSFAAFAQGGGLPQLPKSATDVPRDGHTQSRALGHSSKEPVHTQSVPLRCPLHRDGDELASYKEDDHIGTGTLSKSRPLVGRGRQRALIPRLWHPGLYRPCARLRVRLLATSCKPISLSSTTPHLHPQPAVGFSLQSHGQSESWATALWQSHRHLLPASPGRPNNRIASWSRHLIGLGRSAAWQRRWTTTFYSCWVQSMAFGTLTTTSWLLRPQLRPKRLCRPFSRRYPGTS